MGPAYGIACVCEPGAAKIEAETFLWRPDFPKSCSSYLSNSFNELWPPFSSHTSLDTLMSRPNSSLPRSKEDSPSKSEMMLELGYKEAVQLDAKSSRTSKLLRWWINTLRPACFTKSSALVLRKQVHHTAYLDGLRGFAAFVVYWHHHQLWPRAIADIIFENAYGYENRYYFACLPGVRTFFTGGHFAVAVFFVS